MSETVIHTELASAQAVRCWLREVGSGGLRSAEGPEKPQQLPSPQELTHGKRRCPQGGLEDNSPDLRAACSPPEVVTAVAATTRFQTAVADFHVPM